MPHEACSQPACNGACPVTMETCERSFPELASDFRHIIFGASIVDGWHKVGSAEGLSSDSQIAEFLIQQYHRCKNDTHHILTCEICNLPLPRTCPTCQILQQCNQVLRQKSGKDQKNQDKSTRQAESTGSSCLPVGFSEENQGSRSLQVSTWHASLLSGFSGTDVKDNHLQQSHEGRIDSLSSTAEDRQGSVQDVNPLSTAAPLAGLRQSGVSDVSSFDFTAPATQLRQPDGQEINLYVSTRESDALDVNPFVHTAPFTQLSEGCSGNEGVKKTEHSDDQSSLSFGPVMSDTAVGNIDARLTRTGEGEVKSTRDEHEETERLECQYRCAHCSATFMSKVKLTHHLHNHSREKSYPCSVCEPSFRCTFSLKQHICHAHKSTDVLHCEVCDKSCSTLLDLEQHVRGHKQERLHGKKCTAEQRLQKGTDSKCSTLKGARPWKKAEKVKDATVWKNADNTDGTRCQNNTATGAQPQKTSGMHNRTGVTGKRQKGVRSHVCSECGSSFTNACHLKLHIRSHTGERPFPCSLCSASFTTRDKLRVHMRRHSDERPYVCDLCGKSFRESSVLKTHIRTHTGEKPYICRECGASFAQSSALKTHTRLHTGEKPHMCTVCGAAFPSSSRLDRHTRVHTNHRPYICTECGSAFKSSGELNHHTRTHTKYKPAVCKVCGASFSQLGNMKIHMRIHSGVKPFVCEVCSAAFRQQGGLKMHMLTHTGEKPCVCDICGNSYRKAQTLRLHKQKKHPQRNLTAQAASLEETA